MPTTMSCSFRVSSRTAAKSRGQTAGFGSTQATAARDPNAPRKTGTAIVRGRVVAADTGQPLRRAQVRFMAAELRENRLATTDVDGRYEIKELPAARYTI